MASSREIGHWPPTANRQANDQKVLFCFPRLEYSRGGECLTGVAARFSNASGSAFEDGFAPLGGVEFGETAGGLRHRLLGIRFFQYLLGSITFNSSDYEFAAVGREYFNTLLGKQIDVLTFFKESIKNNDGIKITLKMHPNLSNIENGISKRTLELMGDNFDVIPPESLSFIF